MAPLFPPPLSGRRLAQSASNKMPADGDLPLAAPAGVHPVSGRRLSQSASSSEGFTRGQLAEIFLWNRQLAVEEIRQLAYADFAPVPEALPRGAEAFFSRGGGGMLQDLSAEG
jgi:hypothetical protein